VRASKVQQQQAARTSKVQQQQGVKAS